jgi:alpha-methylacyl-CoA racemase
MPLSGVRVLDLSRLAPGPYATRLLAEMGAQVVKVESPPGGDYTRWIPPLAGEPPQGTTFGELNAGKKGITLNLRDPIHVRVCAQMAQIADVLVDGFRPGIMAKMGLDPQVLMTENPRLIYCALTGFGMTGPDAQRAGHDIGYLARAGVLGTSGTPETPMSLGVQMADIGGSMVAVSGITAALYKREKTGRGSVVDVSLTESAMAFNTINFGTMHGGHSFVRGQELLDGSRPCYGVYACKDGHLAVGALEPKFWVKFLAAIDLEGLDDLGLDGGESGQKTRDIVQQRLREKTRDEWMQILKDVDCCVEPVYHMNEVDGDPQHRARSMLTSANTTRSPIRVTDWDSLETGQPPSLACAPVLGADQEAVLLDWGISADLIRRIST